jgi:hypothetical protein
MVVLEVLEEISSSEVVGRRGVGREEEEEGA